MTTLNPLTKEVVFILTGIKPISGIGADNSYFCECCGVRLNRMLQNQGGVLSLSDSKWHKFGIIGTGLTDINFLATIPDHRYKFIIPDKKQGFTIDWSKADRSLHDL